MIAKWVCLAAAILVSSSLPAQAQDGGQEPPPPHAAVAEVDRVPSGVILVKGAWASASDSSTPLPEGGTITKSVYQNSYFQLSYPLLAGWYQRFSGPPPSDSGYYVLAEIVPNDDFKGSAGGSILIAAQDLFFGLTPAANATDLIHVTRAGLRTDYQPEREPAEVRIAGRNFARFDYTSPVAELHWRVFATEIRCHAVEIVLTSRDTKLLDRLTASLDQLQLPASADDTSGTGGGDEPVCVKNYANYQNLLKRVDPLPTERRYNAIPVRVIVGEDGRVEHIHFLSAFPDQAAAITDALKMWKFKPYLQNGAPVRVETGILFGVSPRKNVRPSTASKTPGAPPAGGAASQGKPAVTN